MIAAGLSRMLGTLLGAALVLGTGCSESSNPTTTGQGGSNTPVLIEPHRGVGKIQAGMTLSQVMGLLGEPDRKQGSTLEYSGLGLAVRAGQDGHVETVMCGDVVGVNGPFVKAFHGRTKDGLGMLSTRAEVVKAWGEPTATKKLPTGMEWLQYDPQGVAFTLEGGKVHHIIVQLGPGTEPDRSVLLEPPPAPEKK